MIFVLVSAGVHYAGLQQIKAGNKRLWQIAGLVALVMGVAAVALQISELLYLPFWPGSSGFSSVFAGFYPVFLTIVLAAMIWLETLLARSRFIPAISFVEQPPTYKEAFAVQRFQASLVRSPRVELPGGDGSIVLGSVLRDRGTYKGRDERPVRRPCRPAGGRDRHEHGRLALVGQCRGAGRHRCRRGACTCAGCAAMVADAKRLGAAARRPGAGEAAAFYGGLLAVLLALVSPLAYWSAHFIWVRSLQDVLLAMVAPGLIVLGAPWLVLRRGLPLRRPRAPGAGPAARARGPRSPARGGVVMAGVACRGDRRVQRGLARLAPARSLRRARCGTRPCTRRRSSPTSAWASRSGCSSSVAAAEPRFAPLSRFMLVAATVVVRTSCSLWCSCSATLCSIPGYAGPAHHVLSVVSDQQAGGAVLFAVALPRLRHRGGGAFIRWLNAEESRL